ncbi:p48 polypeptide of DNA primase [Tieghemiomyces parasiticus]|uniref:DNA primase n=1 Tax=Tieghemiomyces parasiticus TaxID=78921 RepID=A0A9W8AI10_9FUNG|nr:p48 polypeptide of DNA primase [Tieghemiomyces parasiticus]
MSLVTAMDVDTSIDVRSPEYPVLLRSFYDKIFPFTTYYDWLNGCQPTPTKLFQNREFSFTIGNDIYIRYQSFKDADALKAEFLRLCPGKIDIGAVYTTRPRDKKSVLPSAFQPTEKELVFDIDMTDYDEIRTCCQGGDICARCWKFMVVAMKIVHAALVEDFGFRHIMWVYSGRRGVHCWVSDERARRLTNEGRRAVVGYLEVIRGGASQERKVHLPAQLHPHLARSFGIIKEYFSELILIEQDVLRRSDGWAKVLKLFSDEDVRRELRAAWAEDDEQASLDRWDTLDSVLAKVANQRKNKKGGSLALTKRDIVFQYTYPRLDDKVSTAMNHLLKSPFCVHPKTGECGTL